MIIEEDVRNILSAKKKRSNQSGYVYHWQPRKDILAVGYFNKKIQTEENWNNLNLVHIKYLLWTNIRLFLSHMDKSYIWLVETNEHINEFSIVYMINPNLIIKNISKSKWLNVWKIHSVQWTNNILVKYYFKKEC